MNQSHGQLGWLRIVMLFLGCCTSPCLAPALRAEEKPKSASPAVKSYEVELISDIAYYNGEDADKARHKLDVYLPKGHKDFPVIFFVHGGAWRHGDKKSYFGLYKRFAEYWAGQGIGVVSTNYRLSPAVKHPEHIKDVARAFAWTCKNIKKYHGRDDQIFVCGHSAGGHLVSLLSTNDAYLKAEGLGLDKIKGAIPVSGVYDIPPNPLFESIFSKDPVLCRDASPLRHVKEGGLPFLILYADSDLITCGKIPSERFCKALKEKKCTVTSLEVKERNHVSIISKMREDEDPAAKAMREFIEMRCGMKDGVEAGSKKELKIEN